MTKLFPSIEKHEFPTAECTLVTIDGQVIALLTDLKVSQTKVCFTRQLTKYNDRFVPTLIGEFHEVVVTFRNSEGDTLWADRVVGRLKNSGILLSAASGIVHEYFEIVADA